MGAYFLDTSALVKFYHQESGTDVLDGLLHDDDILVISAVARVEFLSALYRKLRKFVVADMQFELIAAKAGFDVFNPIKR